MEEGDWTEVLDELFHGMFCWLQLPLFIPLCLGNLLHIIAENICSLSMGFRQRFYILLRTINVMMLLGSFPLYVVLSTSYQVLTVESRFLDKVTGRRWTRSLSSAVCFRKSVLRFYYFFFKGYSKVISVVHFLARKHSLKVWQIFHCAVVVPLPTSNNFNKRLHVTDQD